MRRLSGGEIAATVATVAGVATAAGLSVDKVVKWMDNLPPSVQRYSPLLYIAAFAVALWLLKTQQPRPIIDVTCDNWVDEEEQTAWEELKFRNVGDELARDIHIPLVDVGGPISVGMSDAITALRPSDPPVTRKLFLSNGLYAATKKLGLTREGMTVMIVVEYYDKLDRRYRDEYVLTHLYIGVTLERLRPNMKVAFTDVRKVSKDCT